MCVLCVPVYLCVCARASVRVCVCIYVCVSVCLYMCMFSCECVCYVGALGFCLSVCLSVWTCACSVLCGRASMRSGRQKSRLFNDDMIVTDSVASCTQNIVPASVGFDS